MFTKLYVFLAENCKILEKGAKKRESMDQVFCQRGLDKNPKYPFRNDSPRPKGKVIAVLM